MTREEQITYKAGSIADGCIAHGAPWKEYYQGFTEGAKWADANPSKPSLPSNLDEAADCYKDTVTPEEVDDSEHAYSYETYTEYQIADAFKAGAEWMAGQGVNADFEVCKLANRAWLTPIDEKKFTQDVFDNFVAGDKVVVQIRKK